MGVLAIVSFSGLVFAPSARAQTSGPRADPQLVPLVWLEPAAGQGDERTDGRDSPLPLLRAIAPGDPRLVEAERLVDNEPARFTRTLIARAWARFGLPATWREARLPVLLEKDGNYARRGFRLQRAEATDTHADVPYIVLDLDAGSLSDTFLHEGGHVLHEIATRGRRPRPWWSPFPHTTFAVTDPLTALAEGFGIHLETLYGHYGRDAAKRAFYHRLDPPFDLRGSRRAEFFAPAADLMTFSQSWARYLGIRDGWAAFAGHHYPGDYLRSQFDPSRDRAQLKPASAMIASEGVAASVLFWTVSSLAEKHGARPGGGLAQPGLLEAEEILLAAFAASTGDASAFRPDLIDVVGHIGADGSFERRTALVRLVEITRGVTAQPSVRACWREFYEAAIVLDQRAIQDVFGVLEKQRVSIHDAAVADAASLRAGVGPVVPVRVPAVQLAIKAFGDPFPLEFDVNAATESEWGMIPGIDAAAAKRILAERDRQPFQSFDDFVRRTGLAPAAVGIESVEKDRPAEAGPHD